MHLFLDSIRVEATYLVASFVTKQKLPEGTTLVSFDVVSLFTKVPVDRAADIAYDRLQNDQTLEERTMLTPNEIKK